MHCSWLRVLETLVINNTLSFSQDWQILKISVCLSLHHASAGAWEVGEDAFYLEALAIGCSFLSCLSLLGVHTCALCALHQCEEDLSPSVAFVLM